MFYSIKFLLGLLFALLGIYFVAENPLAGCSALFVGGVLILSGLNRLYDTER
jgi:hypothetical protein